MPKLLSYLVILSAQNGIFTPSLYNGVLTIDALLLAAEFPILKQLAKTVPKTGGRLFILLVEQLNINYLWLTIFSQLKTIGCVAGILLSLDVLCRLR